MGTLTAVRGGLRIILNSNDDTWQWEDQPGSHLITDIQWKKISFLLGISEREQEVCRLLFEGITREEIANKMDIKVRTVRHYLERLHTKLRVNNRVALVLRIIQVRDALSRIPETEFPDELGLAG
jgi:DNA-binding CsgD family transcriptional regulator